jgi:hypothetical protein
MAQRRRRCLAWHFQAHSTFWIRLGIEFYMGDEKQRHILVCCSEQKDTIEDELGFKLEWMELPERKS